jgi:hypothetical protein
MCVTAHGVLCVTMYECRSVTVSVCVSPSISPASGRQSSQPQRPKQAQGQTWDPQRTKEVESSDTMVH